MIVPRLISPIRVKIARIPSDEIEQDHVFRVPEERMMSRELLERAPKFVVWAQFDFAKGFDTLTMTATGSNDLTEGSFCVTAATQRCHNLKRNDFVVGIIQNNGREIEVQLRIHEVKPFAQRGSFGLYKASYRQVSRGA